MFPDIRVGVDISRNRQSTHFLEANCMSNTFAQFWNNSILSNAPHVVLGKSYFCFCCLKKTWQMFPSIRVGVSTSTNRKSSPLLWSKHLYKMFPDIRVNQVAASPGESNAILLLREKRTTRTTSAQTMPLWTQPCSEITKKISQDRSRSVDAGEQKYTDSVFSLDCFHPEWRRKVARKIISTLAKLIFLSC